MGSRECLSDSQGFREVARRAVRFEEWHAQDRRTVRRRSPAMEVLLGFVCEWVIDYLVTDAADDLTPLLAEGAAYVWGQAADPGLLRQGVEILAGMASVAKVAARVVERVCPGQTPEVKQKVVRYLTQVPAQVRR